MSKLISSKASKTSQRLSNNPMGLNPRKRRRGLESFSTAKNGIDGQRPDPQEMVEIPSSEDEDTIRVVRTQPATQENSRDFAPSSSNGFTPQLKKRLTDHNADQLNDLQWRLNQSTKRQKELEALLQNSVTLRTHKHDLEAANIQGWKDGLNFAVSTPVDELFQQRLQPRSPSILSQKLFMPDPPVGDGNALDSPHPTPTDSEAIAAAEIKGFEKAIATMQSHPTFLAAVAAKKQEAFDYYAQEAAKNFLHGEKMALERYLESPAHQHALEAARKSALNTYLESSPHQKALEAAQEEGRRKFIASSEYMDLSRKAKEAGYEQGRTDAVEEAQRIEHLSTQKQHAPILQDTNASMVSDLACYHNGMRHFLKGLEEYLQRCKKRNTNALQRSNREDEKVVTRSEARNDVFAELLSDISDLEGKVPWVKPAQFSVNEFVDDLMAFPGDCLRASARGL